MASRPFRSLLPLSLLALAACGEDRASPASDAELSADPVLARALYDPLMVDPDLAYRNEANAAITIRHDHALPPLVAGDGADQRAREEARLELLDGGEILPLPDAPNGDGSAALATARSAEAMIRTLGGPRECAARLEQGFSWTARMPAAAQIMPHGMVQQAAGSDTGGCSVRVVRYLTAATIEDALEYHFNRAARAQLRTVRYAQPGPSLRGSRGDEQFFVHARPGPNGLNAVDLVYWKR
ncbi:hypothetical protein [Erythrobacter sp. JK5]|uniref:hypothetical protein n=1 Tax=Erythrobacter sp. JK5 TaxID=2829500 RepID=UPI001BA90CF8|nr:hypothetical protein [Erythrobacter sp. JK5]QUL39197.1 hypothetical protein KDC96_07755 [Erythrobacter sp. JK5]